MKGRKRRERKGLHKREEGDERDGDRKCKKRETEHRTHRKAIGEDSAVPERGPS